MVSDAVKTLLTQTKALLRLGVWKPSQAQYNTDNVETEQVKTKAHKGVTIDNRK